MYKLCLKLRRPAAVCCVFTDSDPHGPARILGAGLLPLQRACVSGKGYDKIQFESQTGWVWDEFLTSLPLFAGLRK